MLRSAAGYARDDARFLVAGVLALSIPQILADLLLSRSHATIVAMIFALAGLYAQLLVTYRTLEHAGAAPAGHDRSDMTEGRFPTAFAASLASGAGILAGLILLVLPGVVLYLVWSLVLPVIAAERADAIGALRRSAALARPRLGMLALVALPIGGAVLAALLLSFAFDRMPEPAASIGYSSWANLSVSATLLFAAAAWTRAYLAARSAAA